MSLVSAIHKAVEKRGSTLVVRIKQDLQSAGKKASGDLISKTKGDTTTRGTLVSFVGTAPFYYDFIDKGVTGTGNFGKNAKNTTKYTSTAGYGFKSKYANIGAIDAWIRKKGLKLNKFAVAFNVAARGVKPTGIYTDNVNKFINELDLISDIRPEIIKDIKNGINDNN